MSAFQLHVNGDCDCDPYACPLCPNECEVCGDLWRDCTCPNDTEETR